MTLIATLSDANIDYYQTLGMRFPGGNSVNVAVHARRLGVPSSWLGRVGTDDEGQFLLRCMAAENVNVERAQSVDGETAWANIVLDNGERTWNGWELGVAPDVSFSAADVDFLAAADIVHSAEFQAPNWIVEVLSRRTRTSYDFGTHSLDEIQPLLPFVTVAFFSAAQNDDAEVEEILASCRRAGVRWSVVSLGDRGCVSSDGARTTRHPAERVQVVDTLGAGDAFAARVLVGLVKGEDLDVACQEAVLYGSRACLDYGAFGHGEAGRYARVASFLPGEANAG